MMPAEGLRIALVGMNVPGYRSLALGYIRSFAQTDPRLAGVAFSTLDLDTSVDPWWIAYRLLELEPAPDVVGFSVMCWNAQRVFETVRVLKAAEPEMLVVVGGPEVGPIARDVLESQADVDVVVSGEGERTFADLAASLLEGAAVHAVPGVTARVRDRIVSAAERPYTVDLDDLPSPYLSGVMRPIDGATYLETYRGCPYRCAYCFEGKGYDRLRHFSKERIAAEIECVASTAGVESFSFIDPVFNLTAERLEWLSGTLEGYARRGLRLHTVEVDIERIGATEARLLSSAGVASVETGPQTVGAAALKTCRRSLDPERFAAGVAALRAEGISVECDLIVGLPGDRFEDVEAGIGFAIGLDPGGVQISTLHVLPGTELWLDAGTLGVRYDSVAPHEVIATREMDYGDLRKAEVFGTAATALYRARVGAASDERTRQRIPEVGR